MQLFTIPLLILNGRLQVQRLRQRRHRQCRRIADTAGAAFGFRLSADAQFRMVSYSTLDNFRYRQTQQKVSQVKSIPIYFKGRH